MAEAPADAPVLFGLSPQARIAMTHASLLSRSRSARRHPGLQVTQKAMSHTDLAGQGADVEPGGRRHQARPLGDREPVGVTPPVRVSRDCRLACTASHQCFRRMFARTHAVARTVARFNAGSAGGGEPKAGARRSAACCINYPCDCSRKNRVCSRCEHGVLMLCVLNESATCAEKTG